MTMVLVKTQATVLVLSFFNVVEFGYDFLFFDLSLSSIRVGLFQYRYLKMTDKMSRKIKRHSQGRIKQWANWAIAPGPALFSAINY